MTLVRRIAETNAKRTSPRNGFTFLEVMVAMSVLAVMFLAISRSLVDSVKLNLVNRESGLAQKAMSATLENIGGAEFTSVFRRYDSIASDNPASGPAPGPDFAVPGLDPLADDLDGRVGKIVLPEFDTGSGIELRENIDMPELGMPRDLNGDGLIDDLDHSGDYKVLPVLLRLDWSGRSGHRHSEVRTILAKR